MKMNRSRTGKKAKKKKKRDKYIKTNFTGYQDILKLNIFHGRAVVY